MGSKSKRRKIVRNVNVDRISNLPDTILGHILSTLPTKVAVTTSILSKRWKYLWTNITNLNFEFLRYLPSSYGDYTPDIIGFMSFVDRVLHLCTSVQIKKILLSCYDKNLDYLRVNVWVSEAIRRNVCELNLEVRQLPQIIFSCKTLTVLKIKSCSHALDIPASVCLPNLKVLHFLVHHPSNDLTQKLFSSCPVLEDLVIDARLADKKEYNFYISTPALKRLKIYNDLYYGRPLECNFVINAPNLGYLDVCLEMVSNYMIENLSSVVEAKIKVEDDNGCAVKLLKALGSVKSLSLYHTTMSALDSASLDTLPTFNDLNRLELVMHISHERRVIPQRVITVLLEKSPNLETLILEKEELYFDTDDILEKKIVWKEPRYVPTCFSSHLKVVKITGFEGYKYVLELVKYLLGNAEVLETLIINLPGMTWEDSMGLLPVLTCKEEGSFCVKLLEFPRVSRTCRIQFIALNF